MNKYVTQFKRETWESPGIFYKAPVVLLILIVVLSAISFYSLHQGGMADWNMHTSSDAWGWGSNAESSPPPEGATVKQTAVEKISHGQYIIYMLFGLACLFNSINYALAALITDRKDRSVLFFKSLPLSEWQVVLTKLAVAVLALPLVYWMFALLTVVAYTAIASTFAKSVLGADPSIIWQQVSFIKTLMLSAVGVVLTALWAMPMYALLLLFSALAKKSPLGLLAALVMLLWILEKWFLGTHILADTLRMYFSGLEVIGQVSFVPLEPEFLWSSALQLLTSVGLYLGLVISALCITAAVWLRNRRFEI